jgi:transposase
MLQTVLGIDVSKATLDVVIMGPRGQSHRVIENTPSGFHKLKRWIKDQKVHACLEATGQYGEGIAEYLYQEGHQVSVVNPARIKRYGESKLHRNKTDKADASLIAEFCSKEKPDLWTPPAAYIKQLRSIRRYLDRVVSIRQQERNRLGSGVQDEVVIQALKQHIAYLEQEQTVLWKAIRQHIQVTPELKRQYDLLVTIPGIKEKTAVNLLAELGDISCYEDVRQVIAYAGLNPKGKKSGTSVHKKAHLSKEGRPVLRAILYMPAVVARHHNPIVRPFCDRVAQHTSIKKVVIGAAMHKLLGIAYGVLKTGLPFNPKYLNPLVSS